MTTILVTGGAGYVGSHACKALAAAGYTPVAYDNLSRGHREFVRWGPLEVGDLHDRARLDDVLARHKPAAAMHFAALSLAPESFERPDDYARVNIEGTRSLLAALDSARVKTLVASSTCAVYGVSDAPITEETPCTPVNPYGQTKLAAEALYAEAERDCGLNWVALRYFNAAGADPDGEIGERHDPEPHLIPRVLDVAAGRGGAVSIYGGDYPTPDGTCIRDYVHVCDLADAHVLALRYAGQTGGGAVFNLGTGRGYSVREVIDTARRITGHPIPEAIGLRRAGDPPRLVAIADRARVALGWTPRYPALTDQIATAWAWHRR